MSKGIARIGLLVGAIAVNVIPGAGQLISGALANAALGVGLTTVGSAFALEATIGSVLTLASIAVGLSSAEKVLGLGSRTPKVSLASIDRLNASCNPTADRKMCLGRTAMAAEIRL